MRDRDSPFRAFVSLLLAVTVPFCCCSFRPWMVDGSTCHDGSSGVPAGLTSERAAPSCHCGIQGKAVEDDASPPTAPRQPGTRDHSCTCAKHYTGMEKSEIEFAPAVLLAILPAFEFELCDAPVEAAALPSRRVPPRPQTSLLRLHCALVV